MYYGLIDGKLLPTERLEWVKLQDNGVFVHCQEDQGQGIILENEIYHVDGRPAIDKPTAQIFWKDDVLRLKEDNGSVMEGLVEIYESSLEQASESTEIMLALAEIYEILIGG